MHSPMHINTSCCICGGGPAGMMLGLLLARSGIPVVVLEKHNDFLRDFRGDTIHPSTIQLMHELGILDEFLKLPHQEVQTLRAIYNDTVIQMADFTHLPIARPVLGLMPQWDFLNFLASQASQYKTFALYTNTNVTSLIRSGNRVTGVVAQTANGPINIHASIVVGTDGRHSIVREQAGLKVITTGAAIDVLWFRLSRKEDDPIETFGRFNHGRMMVMLQRGDYWQCAFVIPKGYTDTIKTAGLPAFQKEVALTSPFMADRVAELTTWDDVKPLSVAIDHLEKWYTEGLICIGDAAHAMSPIGGVGINLAVQDAVATANILYKPLSEHRKITTAMLQKIQQRRAFPAMVIQRGQVFLQDGIINRKKDLEKQNRIPLFLRIIRAFPILQRLPARIIGMGIRPEHIKTPKAS